MKSGQTNGGAGLDPLSVLDLDPQPGVQQARGGHAGDQSARRHQRPGTGRQVVDHARYGRGQGDASAPRETPQIIAGLARRGGGGGGGRDFGVRSQTIGAQALKPRRLGARDDGFAREPVQIEPGGRAGDQGDDGLADAHGLAQIDVDLPHLGLEGGGQGPGRRGVELGLTIGGDGLLQRFRLGRSGAHGDDRRRRRLFRRSGTGPQPGHDRQTQGRGAEDGPRLHLIKVPDASSSAVHCSSSA